LDFDPYIILGVPVTATEEDVRIAYRKLSRRFHPDVNKSPAATLQFRDITAAHNLLTDKLSRQHYEDSQAAVPADPQARFSVRAIASKREVQPLSEQQIVYILADIVPVHPSGALIEDRSAESHANLNLTLVLDQSNSMNGTRLDRVKAATQRIIDYLGENDFLSVVTFNDRADVLIPSTRVTDSNRHNLKARVSLIGASGGTEMYKGLSRGIEQNRRNLAADLVNQTIMITDGHTFGDEEKCVALARSVAKDGIAISALGLGHDWNSQLLDSLASETGGTSAFMTSSDEVVRFMNSHIRTLSQAFAERLNVSVAPDRDVNLDMLFKLAPHPQPLSATQELVPLGPLFAKRPIRFLLQLVLPEDMSIGFRGVVRIVVSGDVLGKKRKRFYAVTDFSLDVTNTPRQEEPPVEIFDALSKLTLYKLQERAQAALEAGNVPEATRRLEHLATRLLERGENSLAQQAVSEAKRVTELKSISEVGRKTLVYQTRSLMLSGGDPSMYLMDEKA
jgi:Ca-activated chloride channel homolog